MLDSVEFAIGSPNSTWGSLRAKLGHPTPFNLRHIAFGNEGCDLKSYTGVLARIYIIFVLAHTPHTTYIFH